MFRKLLRNIWGGIRSNIGGIVGGAIGGIIGVAVGNWIQNQIEKLVERHDSFRDSPFGMHGVTLDADVEDKVMAWSEAVFSPYMINAFKEIDLPSSEIVTKRYAELYNRHLLNLRSWQSYYEALNRISEDAKEQQIALAKSVVIMSAVDALTKVYDEVVVDSVFFFETQDYNPTKITKIGNEALEWAKHGIKSIIAKGIFLTDGAEIPQEDKVILDYSDIKNKLDKVELEDITNLKDNVETNLTDDNKTPPLESIDDVLDMISNESKLPAPGDEDTAAKNRKNNLYKIAGAAAIIYLLTK